VKLTPSCFIYAGQLIADDLSKQIPSFYWLSELRDNAGTGDSSPQEKKTEYYHHISKAMVGLFLPDIGFDSHRYVRIST
jgi:hypothetical protein